MYFFLFIVAILISIPGIILLLLGFIHKKPGQWIPGIVLSSFAVLMVILTFVIIVRKATRVIDKNINWHQEYSYRDHYDDNYGKNDYYYNSPENSFENKSDTVAELKEVSGFIKGYDNKLTLITVKTDALLIAKGIAVGTIENYTSTSLKKNGIPLEIVFLEDFKGGITLNAYDEGNNFISSSSIDCSGQKGNSMSIEFDFEKSIKFSSIKYCTLSEKAAQ